MKDGQRSSVKAAVDTPRYQPVLGDRLRALRTARSLSLAEVAELTDISKSFLALVESGRSDISISRLLRLADFYEVNCVELLPDVDADAPTIVRRDQRKVAALGATAAKAELLASDAVGGLTGMLTELGPDEMASEFRSHPGTEVVYVIAGQLTLEFSDGRTSALASGDSACFAADRRHRYRNSGKHRLCFISVGFGGSALETDLQAGLRGSSF